MRPSFKYELLCTLYILQNSTKQWVLESSQADILDNLLVWRHFLKMLKNELYRTKILKEYFDHLQWLVQNFPIYGTHSNIGMRNFRY